MAEPNNPEPNPNSTSESKTLIQRFNENPPAFIFTIMGSAVFLTILIVLTKYLKELLELLSQASQARALITFLMAFVTVSVAIILIMYAALSESDQAKERFIMGKEIFTALLGILGTIVGFYFGATKDAGPPPQPGQTPPAAVATIKLSSDQLTKTQPITLEGKITAGTAPYTYAITFEPKNILADIPATESKDGNIKQELTIPANLTSGGNVGFQIDIKDKDGKPFVYKDDTRKIQVKIP